MRTDGCGGRITANAPAAGRTGLCRIGYVGGTLPVSAAVGARAVLEDTLAGLRRSTTVHLVANARELCRCARPVGLPAGLPQHAGGRQQRGDVVTLRRRASRLCVRALPIYRPIVSFLRAAGHAHAAADRDSGADVRAVQQARAGDDAAQRGAGVLHLRPAFGGVDHARLFRGPAEGARGERLDRRRRPLPCLRQHRAATREARPGGRRHPMPAAGVERFSLCCSADQQCYADLASENDELLGWRFRRGLGRFDRLRHAGDPAGNHFLVCGAALSCRRTVLRGGKRLTRHIADARGNQERSGGTTMPMLNRRQLLMAATAGGVMAAARPTLAQSKPDKLVYIGDNQGGWKRALTEEVGPAFEKETGIKVEFTLLPPDAWLARLKAEMGAGSSGIDITQWSVGMGGWVSPHMLDHNEVLARITA